GVEFLMDHRHLWLRSSRQHAILRVRASLVRALRDFFDTRGFVLVDAPIFTPAACEGTTTLFETDYFGDKAYLTQSGQLYMEAAKLVHDKGHAFAWGGDFGSPDETEIAGALERPVFVHHFPTGVKAFYMEPDADRPETCLSVDCLAPEGYGEITGGGQRTASL